MPGHHSGVHRVRRAPLPRITTYGREEEARTYAQRLLTDCQHPGFQADLMVEALLAHLRWRAHIGSLAPPRLIPQPLAACMRLIDRAFATDISIEDLCRQSGLSSSHLHAQFRQHLKHSPHQVILDRRLQEARLLLSSTALPIAAVAARCGFGDAPHFSRRFKRSQGETPREYRLRWAPPGGRH